MKLIKSSWQSHFFINDIHDYVELCKPKVVLLMVITVMVGMFLVPEKYSLTLPVFIAGNFGIALCAAAAATLNHIVDQKIDSRMARTFNRPVARGRVTTANALIFSLILTILGAMILWLFTNPLTVLLTILASVGYALIYTFFLKRASPQNIVIGGLAGAAPPLLGWVAITGQIHPDAILLMLIIFAWTPPHFWALAVHRKEEYAKVKIPMLPVTHGEHYTKMHILLYSVLMVISTVLPFLTGMFGVIYLTGAIILGSLFLVYSVRLLFGEAKRWAMPTFRYSIFYLFALFVLMVADKQLTI